LIIGQDPYHGKGEAHGLCFSTKGKKIPPSLKNIHKECGIGNPSHGDLTKWAAQGVLLLNATLTVREGIPRSHRRKGWEKFTVAVIRAVSDKPQPVVFLLWGRDAQEKGALITARKRHLVLEASHPSPLSVSSELRDGEIPSFRDCGHFKTANAHLKKHGLERIDWQSRLYT
jgi:uracil-DNA glycosylase